MFSSDCNQFRGNSLWIDHLKCFNSVENDHSRRWARQFLGWFTHRRSNGVWICCCVPLVSIGLSTGQMETNQTNSATKWNAEISYFDRKLTTSCGGPALFSMSLHRNDWFNLHFLLMIHTLLLIQPRVWFIYANELINDSVKPLISIGFVSISINVSNIQSNRTSVNSIPGFSLLFFFFFLSLF